MSGTVTPMGKLAKRRIKLSTEITIVIILKLIVLYVLWSIFIAPNRVNVDAQSMFERVQSQTNAEQIKE